MKNQLINSLWIGLLAGCFGGLVGLGGGVVMIPLMVGVFKITQHRAHGTSLFALVFTGITGAVTYGMKGSVDVIGSLILAVTAIFTARTGARFAHSLPEWKLKRAFGAFLIFASLILIAKPYLAHLYHFEITGILKVIILLAIGVFAGFLAGMMGVGGGSVMVPALVLILNYGQHIAQGTSLLCMVPAGIVGAYTHLRLGNVIKELLPGLIAGIIIGTYVGSNIAHALSDAYLRIIFALIITFTGIKYLKTPKSDK
ncbi:MAG TPA: sulfite exporter TauE/SafE family protein [Thermodesulfovibrio thiophilus]|uniref:sulfite exporter TauE/SafE family protein n=1 Tax=Thermodesulfovibrio thiophilus TaxID=340095 RepID=UPI002353B230|nr:sulfite exporter TauE/SafE family protein [Thermodesulfovibrio thiophilus]HQD36514.1 sulfite exporter TauE/SafE family protein [Thermodesulfovibrio thiophilus]